MTPLLKKRLFHVFLHFRLSASWSRTWIFYFSSLISRKHIRRRKHSKVIRSNKSCSNNIVIWSMFLLLISVSSVYFFHWNFYCFYINNLSCMDVLVGNKFKILYQIQIKVFVSFIICASILHWFGNKYFKNTLSMWKLKMFWKKC